MALTKARIADGLVHTVGLNRSEAKDFVDAFFDALRTTLAEERPVKLSGFGSFRSRPKRARLGRHPKTGAPMAIEARRIVTFQASTLLSDRLWLHGKATCEFVRNGDLSCPYPLLDQADGSAAFDVAEESPSLCHQGACLEPDCLE